eukprot:1691015-Alexandrium_andersonii.AAC.1
MGLSRFGSGGVALRRPHLGGVVVCRGPLGPPPTGQWAPLDLRRARGAAWQKAVHKYSTRAATLGGSLPPPGGRAGSRNTFVATVLSYLARVFRVDGSLRTCLERGMATAFGASGWAPPMALSALGVARG